MTAAREALQAAGAFLIAIAFMIASIPLLPFGLAAWLEFHRQPPAPSLDIAP